VAGADGEAHSAFTLSTVHPEFDMPDTALLVIDAQASFTRRPYFSHDGMPEWLSAQNRLIAGALQRQWAVVRVWHVDPSAGADDPFSLASGLVSPIEGLMPFEATHTVHKTRHSALVGSGLDVWLVQHGIRRLVVSGIRTEQCCETTTRHASDLGWQVSYVPEATMSWPLRGPDGVVLSLAELRQRTAAVLQGRFAEVQSVDDALAA
jgi:nicotinamidase-related amidase